MKKDVLKAVIFAGTFAAAQIAAGLTMVKLVANKRFIKKYAKMAAEISEELEEE